MKFKLFLSLITICHLTFSQNCDNYQYIKISHQTTITLHSPRTQQIIFTNSNGNELPYTVSDYNDTDDFDLFIDEEILNTEPLPFGISANCGDDSGWIIAEDEYMIFNFSSSIQINEIQCHHGYNTSERAATWLIEGSNDGLNWNYLQEIDFIAPTCGWYSFNICSNTSGCTNENACNYNENATIDNNSCDYSCFGCTEEEACNYNTDNNECSKWLYFDNETTDTDIEVQLYIII